MKIAITGANGFLGRHLLRCWVDRFELVAISRHAASLRVPCRISDYTSDSLTPLMEGCQAVVHLAARRPLGLNGAEVMPNVLLDQCVFEAAERAGVRHVVLASTRGVYGGMPAPWCESMQPEPLTLYALAKLQSEQLAAFYRRRGITATVLRLSQLFGEGEYEGSAVNTFITHAQHKRTVRISVTGLRREYTYVDDVAQAIGRVLDSPADGVFNLGSGEVVSMLDMATQVFEAFGRPSADVVVADDAGVSTEFSLMDSSRFRQAFGWRPQFTLHQGARAVAARMGHATSGVS